MADVTSGNILVAYDKDFCIVKMRGDVRLTLCVPFDQFIETLFNQGSVSQVFFDFSEAEGIDSTTLGLIAKLAVKAETLTGNKAKIVNADAGISRLLDVTGIIDLCEVLEQFAIDLDDRDAFSMLAASDGYDDEESVRQKVLESHRLLMQLNEVNKAKFEDLVSTLSRS